MASNLETTKKATVGGSMREPAISTAGRGAPLSG
jgi:hypothetical protein